MRCEMVGHLAAVQRCGPEQRRHKNEITGPNNRVVPNQRVNEQLLRVVGKVHLVVGFENGRDGLCNRQNNKKILSQKVPNL